MKFSLQRLHLLILSLIVFSCQKDNSIQITGDVKNLEAEEITLANITTGFYDTISIASGLINHTLDIDQPQIVYMTAGSIRDYLYLTPASTLIIKYDSSQSQLTFEGSLGLQNNTLRDIGNQLSEISRKQPLYAIANNPEDTFLDEVEKKFEALNENLTSEKEKLSPALYTLIEKRILAAMSSDKTSYPKYYEYTKKAPVELSGGYFDYLEGIDPNDVDFLAFEEGRSFIQSIIEKDIDYQELGSIQKYYSALFEKVDKSFTNPAIKEYFSYKYLTDKINFGGGIDGVEDLISKFYTSTTNLIYVNKIKDLEIEWADLKSGLPAPDFDGTTREGQSVSLSDLKGQNVYVDVWATWCGPCIAEIPSLKEIEHDYENKNIEFISISIDNQKDKEKWMKFIDDRSLGGTQLFADGDWNSTVVNAYNIKGIPRFILIDENGNIVKADAPRPSSPDLRSLFNDVGI